MRSGFVDRGESRTRKSLLRRSVVRLRTHGAVPGWLTSAKIRRVSIVDGMGFGRVGQGKPGAGCPIRRRANDASIL